MSDRICDPARRHDVHGCHVQRTPDLGARERAAHYMRTGGGERGAYDTAMPSYELVQFSAFGCRDLRWRDTQIEDLGFRVQG